MKTLLFNILILASLAMNFPGFKSSTETNEKAEFINEFDGKHTSQKKIRKEFRVSSNSFLNIDNSYGNVDIKTWDQNRVLIEVIIKTNGNDEEEVEEKLENIYVDFNQTSSGVRAETKFSKESRSWWKNIFSGFDNVNMEVNYIIRAPESNHLEIDNNYGGIYIDKTSGNTKISCDYGKMDIGELNGRSNSLNFDYTRNSRIGYVTSAEIDADYSDYEIGEADQLQISADYSKSKIGKVAQLDFNCDYGSIEIDKVKVLIGNGDYLTTNINRIFTSADINLDYGSLSIEKIIKGTKTVNIDTDYAGVNLGYDNEMSFNINVKTSYGSIKGTEGIDISRTDQRNTSNSISGKYGSGRETDINISTSYGSVNLKRQ